MEGYLGEIRFFAGNYAPANWALCQGQLLAISEYEALFTLLGAEYGGDGRTNFKLPDFRGRTIISPDSSVGLYRSHLGGQENVTLQYANLPAHKHSLFADTNSVSQYTPSGNIFAKPTGSVVVGRETVAVNSKSYTNNTEGLIDMNDAMISPVGGGQPHNNMQPFLGINYIICIKGDYPSRN